MIATACWSQPESKHGTSKTKLLGPSFQDRSCETKACCLLNSLIAGDGDRFGAVPASTGIYACPVDYDEACKLFVSTLLTSFFYATLDGADAEACTLAKAGKRLCIIPLSAGDLFP